MRLSLHRLLPVLACAFAVAGMSAASAAARAGHGFAATAFPGHHAATSLVSVSTERASALSASGAGLAGYTFTPIAFPGHQAATFPWNVNAEGAIIGEYWAGQANASQTFGFVEDFGHYMTITEPNRGPYDQMNAMESTQSGDVIGGYYTGTSAATNGLDGRVYIDHNGHFTNLNDPNADGIGGAGCTSGGTPVPCGTWPGSANFSGEVAGWYWDSNGNSHGFIYQHGHFTTVDYPGAAGTQLAQVSDQGLVSGTEWDQNGNQTNFLYTRQGRFVTFPDLTNEQAPGILPNTSILNDYGDATQLFSVNDHHVQGGYYFAAPTAGSACGGDIGLSVNGFVERHGWVTDLVVPSTTIPLPDISNPNTCVMNMYGANEAGQAVGFYLDFSKSVVAPYPPPDSYGFLITPNF